MRNQNLFFDAIKSSNQVLDSEPNAVLKFLFSYDVQQKTRVSDVIAV